MPRDPRRELLYLADIVESARMVERWLAERDGQWDDDEILRNAVLRQLSVVGEAASCLSDDTGVVRGHSVAGDPRVPQHRGPRVLQPRLGRCA